VFGVSFVPRSPFASDSVVRRSEFRLHKMSSLIAHMLADIKPFRTGELVPLLPSYPSILCLHIVWRSATLSGSLFSPSFSELRYRPNFWEECLVEKMIRFVGSCHANIFMPFIARIGGLKEREHLEDLVVDGEIALKQM